VLRKVLHFSISSQEVFSGLKNGRGRKSKCQGEIGEIEDRGAGCVEKLQSFTQCYKIVRPAASLGCGHRCQRIGEYKVCELSISLNNKYVIIFDFS
jgi:hypothetical protein